MKCKHRACLIGHSKPLARKHRNGEAPQRYRGLDPSARATVDLKPEAAYGNRTGYEIKSEPKHGPSRKDTEQPTEMQPIPRPAQAVHEPKPRPGIGQDSVHPNRRG